MNAFLFILPDRPAQEGVSCDTLQMREIWYRKVLSEFWIQTSETNAGEMRRVI